MRTQKERREQKKRLLIEIHNAILLRAEMSMDSPWFNERTVEFRIGEAIFTIDNDLKALIRFKRLVKAKFPIKEKGFTVGPRISDISVQREVNRIRRCYDKSDNIITHREMARDIFKSKISGYDHNLFYGKE